MPPSQETNTPIEELGKSSGEILTRSVLPGMDLLRPWKWISNGNIYIIYLSVLLFGFYAFTRHGFNGIALTTSLFISLPVGFAIAYFETQSTEFRRRHRRTRFWVYLLIRTLRVTSWFMFMFFITMLVLILFRVNTDETIFPHSLYDFFATRKLFVFLGLALFISLFSNFMDELHRKLGRDAIYNIVFGKYHQVKQEERLFLFIDLNHSTDIAEEMGELEFSHFLQDYYYDISEPIARYLGQVYQYVGDEVVVTWPVKKGFRYALCIRCFFAIQKQIRRYEKQYMARYNRVPEFKAALHGGGVVVSEVGKYKSEIAYHGDVLNTTARMLGKCHDLNADFIISEYIRERVDMPKYLNGESKGSFQLKGKQQEIDLYSVYMTIAPGNKVRKGRRNIFRRKSRDAKQDTA
ncbi:MAG: adenylate/guanylate cyclase domain-containing protein [Chitinophagaceae bacterium]|nr:adenylate/guanylate cyclase domain-containing protein [Chitinophagaceae bacterium]